MYKLFNRGNLSLTALVFFRYKLLINKIILTDYVLSCATQL